MAGAIGPGDMPLCVDSGRSGELAVGSVYECSAVGRGIHDCSACGSRSWVDLVGLPVLVSAFCVHQFTPAGRRGDFASALRKATEPSELEPV